MILTTAGNIEIARTVKNIVSRYLKSNRAYPNAANDTTMTMSIVCVVEISTEFKNHLTIGALDELERTLA
jgi:hypothetical protein